MFGRYRDILKKFDENEIMNLSNDKCVFIIAIRKEVKIEINKAYKNFVNESERKIGEDPREFWNIMHNKRGKSKITSVMKDQIIPRINHKM